MFKSEFTLFKKNYIPLRNDKLTFTGWDILILRLKYFSVSWFTDCGEWFIYITIGDNVWRFSGAGFMKYKREGENK